MNTFKKLAIVSALALTGTMANAAVVSFDDLDNGLETTEIDQTIELGLFDSALGTLDSVMFTFQGSANTEFELTNNAAQAQTLQAEFDVNLFFQPDVGPLMFAVPALSVNLVDTGFITLSPGETQAFDNTGVTDVFTFTFDAMTDDLTAFIATGGGALDFTCSSLSSISFTGGGGNVDSSQTTNAGCTGEVEYTYSIPTPPTNVNAPATALVLGLGLGLMGLRRKVNLK